MPAPPYMKLYPKDFAADTMHLLPDEAGGYVYLMIHYWLHGELPEDEDRIARIARATPEAWPRVRAALYPLFKAGHWRHSRIDRELGAVTTDLSSHAERGRKGAAKRWGQPGDKSLDDGTANSSANSSSHGVAIAKDMTQPLAEPSENGYSHSSANGKPMAYQIADSRKKEREDASRPALEEGHSRNRGKGGQTELPNDCVLSDLGPDARIAAQSYGMSEDEITAEAEKFASWNRAQGTMSANWLDSWRVWCGRWRDRNPGRKAVTPIAGPVLASRMHITPVLNPEQWAAWEAYRKANNQRPMPLDARGGWNVDTEWPPMHPNHKVAT